MSAIDKPFNGNLAVTPSMPEIGSWDATCCPPLLCAHSRWHHHLLAGRVTDMMALHAFPLALPLATSNLLSAMLKAPVFGSATASSLTLCSGIVGRQFPCTICSDPNHPPLPLCTF